MEHTEQATVVMKQCKCLRCGYVWLPNVPLPKSCPDCKSRLWNRPREEDVRHTVRHEDKGHE